MDRHYAFFDADGIGDCLELLLLDDKIRDAAVTSNAITDAMISVRESLSAIEGVVIELFGGDDLIVSFLNSHFANDDIEGARRLFKQATGKSISVGVGASPSEALLNLRRAKLSGKDRVVGQRSVE